MERKGRPANKNLSAGRSRISEWGGVRLSRVTRLLCKLTSKRMTTRFLPLKKGSNVIRPNRPEIFVGRSDHDGVVGGVHPRSVHSKDTTTHVLGGGVGEILVTSPAPNYVGRVFKARH